MKILAFSDSHYEIKAMQRAIRKHKDAEVIIFCGDGESDLQTIRLEYPDKHYLAVRGNCDWYATFPYTEEMMICGRKFFVTHGHLLGVKQGYQRLINMGRSVSADVVVFGHTHKQFTSVEGPMLFMNPGSIGFGERYSVIELSEDSDQVKVTEYPHDEFGPVKVDLKRHSQPTITE